LGTNEQVYANAPENNDLELNEPVLYAELRLMDDDSDTYTSVV